MVVFRVSATGNEIGGPASSATDGFEFRSRFFPRFFHMKIALTLICLKICQLILK